MSKIVFDLTQSSPEEIFHIANMLMEVSRSLDDDGKVMTIRHLSDYLPGDTGWCGESMDYGRLLSKDRV